MTPSKNHTDLLFLSGGGEMGALTRSKDWSKTTLGDPRGWPQSLRTTLSILLNSKFPMFLWWGPELICFYNDAYRPSLGTNGKHPSILGERAETAWAEIWTIIKPLIDQVFAGGESTWSEDQLIPIFRNGKIEDVYWTFSYSPVNDESGKVSGVLVTCSETTEKVNMIYQLQASEQRFRNSVQQAPLGITVLRGSQFIVEMANPTYLSLVDKNEADFVGLPLFDSLPEVKEIVEPLLTNVLNTGISYQASDLSVILKRYGKEERAYFNLVYHPLREESGEISGIMVVATEVTASVKAKLALAESEKQFRSLVMQSPIPMTIFRGEDYIIEMANTMMFENIWRKTEAEVLGKKALEVFPELNNQKYPALLREVYTSGKSYSEKESLALVEGADGLKKFYLDFEYSPLFEPDESISGIMITVNDVTEKVTARMQLEESELQFRTMAERLNLVIEASELGTWEWQVKSDHVSFSDRYLQIFGYPDSASLDHNKLLAHIHPEDKQLRDSAVEEAFRLGVLDYKARIIWKDRSVHWIEAKGKVFYDDQQQVEKLIGTVRDITEEKYRQQELFENEQRFRLLADSMPQHIWTADTEGTLNYFNQSVYNYSGLSVEELDTDGWLQIVHPDDREENIALWTESIRTGKDFLCEHRFRRHDGEYRWQLSRAMPQKDAQGNIQMWVGTSTDIQEQKMFTSELEKQVRERTKELLNLNESLAKSEERYHLMVEEVEDYAILYLNKDGIVQNWNKGAEKIKGYRADEIIGKSFSSFYTPADRESGLPEKLLHLAATTGKAIQEGWRIRKNGTLFWASVAITAVHDSQNHVIGFSKVTHDLTEKKTADDLLKLNAEQLEQKNRDLEKINAELKSFAYVSSHDLQEPLRKIQTFASRILAKEAESLTDKGKDYFRRMQEAADRMQTLIQDLLAYSRTNITDRTFENTSLQDIVNEVKREIKETITEKNAIIETGAMCRMNIISFQFRQLLFNLLGNALKFSKPGIPPHITIQSEIVRGDKTEIPSLSPEKMYCHISVADNGIGFDPQYKERIFEVFQRLHGKAEYSGTGIGLAIVKKIVENHNGVITATGELNHGARFDIYIPA